MVDEVEFDDESDGGKKIPYAFSLYFHPSSLIEYFRQRNCNSIFFCCYSTFLSFIDVILLGMKRTL